MCTGMCGKDWKGSPTHGATWPLSPCGEKGLEGHTPKQYHQGLVCGWDWGQFFFLPYTFLSPERLALCTGNTHKLKKKKMLLPLQGKKMPSQVVSSELVTGVCFWWGWGCWSEGRQLSIKGALGTPRVRSPHPLSPCYGGGWRFDFRGSENHHLLPHAHPLGAER